MIAGRKVSNGHQFRAFYCSVLQEPEGLLPRAHRAKRGSYHPGALAKQPNKIVFEWFRQGL